MTSQAEDVLYLSLTDTDALETLAVVGLELEAIPTEEMRPVVQWAIDRFFESGRTRAPSREALLETWGDHIEQAKVELLPEDEDSDTIRWAIDQLTSHFIHYQFQQFIKDAGMAMATAQVPDRREQLAIQADALFALSQRVQPRHMETEFGRGLERALAEYEGRALAGHAYRGILFDLPLVDEHTFGIHPGELAVVAGGPKMGKSFFVDHIAKGVWKSDDVVCLFTLENSVEMTLNRLVCMHFGIDPERWQKGECFPEEVEKVRWFINDELPKVEGLLHIISPEPGQRTVASMVRRAQILGAKGIIIDQTSHVEHPDPGRKARHEIVSENLHLLKLLISSTSQPMSAVIAHQINREGVKAAKKLGYLEMEHLAESSGTERVVDWAFGLYQGVDDRIAGEALLQVLASRRADIKAWKMVWQPSSGLVSTIRETQIEALA